MNRNFLITGAAQGLGLEFTRRALLGDGRVVMADLAKEQGEKSMKELEKEFGVGKVCFVHLDVRDEEMWKNAWDEAEKFFGGQVQVLMNNAGVYSKNNWKLMLDVNLGGLAIGTMLAMERMGVSRGGQGGLIFQTASIASLLSGSLSSAEEEMYTATKWATLGWTRSLGKQDTFDKEKVKMIAVCPDLTNTNMAQGFLGENKEQTKYAMMEAMEAADVARAVEHAIVYGESGDVITVCRDMVFYYPDIQKMVFVLYKGIHTLLVRLGRIPTTQAVTTRQIRLVFGLLVLGMGFLFHILLCFLGL